MSTFLRNLSFGLLTITGHSLASAAPTTPYLETIPATVVWQFNVTGTGKSRVPQPIDTNKPVEDPDTIKPVDRVTTETGTPVTYTGGNGNQAFFVRQLLRAVLERYANETQEYLVPASLKQAAAAKALADAATAYANADAATIAGNTDAAAQYNAEGDALTAQAGTLEAEAKALIDEALKIEAVIKQISRQLNDEWELTFVRAPQTTAEGVMTTPYWLFLTKVDSLQSRNIIGLDTGLRLTPKYSAGTASESYTGDVLTKASGSITTYFTLEFTNLFANDPLSGIELVSRGGAVSAVTNEQLLDFIRTGEFTTIPQGNCNTAGEFWTAHGSGYLTYSLRRINGTANGVAPTKMKATGVGSWNHLKFDLGANEYALFGGTAPLNIKLGEVKYQRSDYFPEYTPPAAP